MKPNRNSNSVHLEAFPGELKIIRLNILNRLIIPAVIHIKMDDWVNSKGQIIQTEFSASPSYQYIAPRGTGKFTITLKIPSSSLQGEVLQTALRIPGLQEQRVPLTAAVKKNQKKTKTISETDITLSVPAEQKKSEQRDEVLQTQSTLKLLTYMAGVEIIPTKWLLSELIIHVCNSGLEEAKTLKGAEWLKKMALTRFYKNGCMVFRGSQLPQWIIIASGISTGIGSLTGNNQNASMIHTWEQWLLNLVDSDIESPDFKEKEIAGFSVDKTELLRDCGTEPEKWFGYFILGLAQISPRFREITDQVLKKAKESRQPIEKTRKKKDIMNEKGSLQK